jgi:outer membrane protein
MHQIASSSEAGKRPRAVRVHLSRACLLALVVSVAGWGGCSVWDLGPEPDHYVGPGQGPAQRVTDARFEAVVPVVPGDRAGGGAELPSAAMSATRPATQPAATPAAAATAPSLAPEKPPTRGQVPEALSVQDAILTGLQNNTNLRVQVYNVPIRRTSEEQTAAQFDPTVSGSISGGRAVNGGRTSDTLNVNATVTEFLPTGTTVEAGITTSNTFYSEHNSSIGPTLTVTQALLRGAGLDVNLASLREAELATKVTQYQLRGVAESLVADIETGYWDLAYAERQLAIVQNALEVAQKQLDDTATRIQVGALSPSEQPAAEAELAQRREDLINAESALQTSRMRFLQLLAPAARAFWDQKVTLTTLPFIPSGAMDDVEAHVVAALRFRPDVNQTRLQLQRGDLEIVRTKNGLLPRLDLFVNLGKTGYANTLGNAIQDLNGTDYQAILGVRGDWSPMNRSAEATYRAAQLSKEQLIDTMANLEQTVQLDVRTQYIEVERTRKQIDATRATRIASEATLRVQQGKLAAGNGTSLDVAIAQRNVLSSQLTEVQAVTGHLKSLVSLYRLEGTLLLRRGLDAPGKDPVEGIAWTR